MRLLTNDGVELVWGDGNRISSLFFFSGSRMANIFNLLLVRMYGMLRATFRWCNMKHIELFIGDVEWMNGSVVKIYDSHRRQKIDGWIGVAAAPRIRGRANELFDFYKLSIISQSI